MSVTAPRGQTDEDTDIVRDVLPTDVQQRSREVAVRHLQPVVDRPQRGAKAVAYARETAARRRVRLEHHKVLSELLRNSRAVKIRLDDALARGVREVICEDVLRVDDRAEAVPGEGSGAVLLGIAV